MIDIGCDHGLLGLSFIESPHIQNIQLVDQSLKVINVLKKKLIGSYISKRDSINVLHANGQDLILGPERKCIFIAGMGGKEITEILIHLANQLNRDDKVIVSPHRNILELRKFLFHSSYKLIDEACIKENGLFYQIIGLQKCPNKSQVSLYGEHIWKGEEGAQYLEHQLSALKNHQDPESIAYMNYLKLLAC